MMKNLLLRLLVSCIFSFIIFSVKANKVDLPALYEIIKSIPNKDLKNTEAIFVFSFTTNTTTSSNQKLLNQDIKFSYNGINKTIKLDENGNIIFKIRPGKFLFQFFYNEEFYEIKTDSIEIKPTYRTEIKVNFQSSKFPVIVKKPVIYVYPEESLQINIKLSLDGELNFTYPKYDDEEGWNFTADPDGTIYMDEKKYHYLFWDANIYIDNNTINWKKGFIVIS